MKNCDATVLTAFTVGLLSNLTDEVQKKRRKVFFIPKLLLPLQSQVKNKGSVVGDLGKNTRPTTTIQRVWRNW